MASTDLIDELTWRGLKHQATDEDGLRAHLAAGTRLIYAGFDPTADSLTVGNLVPIMMLRHVQRAGHRPVVLMGGGTGLIGDPSGKSAERDLQSPERVEANILGQRRIFERLLDCSGPLGAPIVNNADWLGRLGYIEVLRDVGKHFSVNQMVQRDSVRTRLEGREQGISYTEFSYMILQAYDFLHLFRSMGVTVQFGGSDQYGNILSGCDLIRRAVFRTGEADAGPQAYGLTAPLVTRADGGKFGKTERGAVWLTADRTSPYAYYQFWLNAADADAGRFLRIYTLCTREQIEAAEAEQARDPGARPAQRLLAREATALLHGRDEMLRAEAAAGALFKGDLASLDRATLDEALGAAPTSDHARPLLAGDGVPLAEVLATTLCRSKSEARQALTEGSVSVNGRKAAADARLTVADLLHGEVIALRRGKKHWHVTRWK
ncbi:MAG: tyrosine--tRNA ligase [Phycisphaerae bacterium]|nr:tyrosine--tRNA ligase [Phycisphaerae bacterium]